MKTLTIASLLGLALASIGLTGCEDKATITQEKTISTPEGTSSSKTETTIKKSGENPPPAP